MTPPTTNNSPSSSSSSATISSSSDPSRNPNPNPNPNSTSSTTTQSWWESVSKAQSRIHSLSSLLRSPSLLPLADSDNPSLSLLHSPDSYLAVSAALSLPSSGSGHDPLCQWLYETLSSPDPHLPLVPLSFAPLLAGLYLSRLAASSLSNPPPLAGFEAVLLALHNSEAKLRSGKPLLINVPNISHPSIYHTPSKPPVSANNPTVGLLSPPLEPQVAVKSTQRASIVGVALECYCGRISLMPPCSKVDLCEFVCAWAGQDCACRFEFDEELRVGGACGDERVSRRGARVPLPWELLQPVLRILGHCLMAPLMPEEVRDAASAAVRCVYARASHDVAPQVILAARSLIQLDRSTRKSERDAAVFAGEGAASSASTPGKPRRPEVLLVSK